MRKLAAAAIVGVLALTGCSSSPNLTDAYHKVARAMPAYSDRTNDQLDKAGKAICKVFDADASTGYDAAVGVVSETSDPAQAGVFVKAAVAAYCPQYKDDLK